MTYAETLDYLFSQLPMFQRVGKAAYKPDLSITHELCDYLGNPERKFRSVHLAGTNGKGSTSHFLASTLQEAGLKVGLYTSPHLRDFRERIRLNGQMIPEAEVVEFVARHKDATAALKLSFFEWTIGLAFDYFAREAVDIAVLETGMGGRLDSTNVVVPELTLITNIGLDHQQFLGDTLTEIAGEKAGIVKQGIPLVVNETQEEVRKVFESVAEAKQAPVFFADQEIKEQGYPLGLQGNYQRANAKGAVLAARILAQQGWPIQEKHIEQGLANVEANTGLLGRWQTLSTSPLTIADTAHNCDGLTLVLQQLETLPHEKLHIVLGVVGDKSIDGILPLFPKTAHYYFCQAVIPRALAVEELKVKAEATGLQGDTHPSVKAALSAAKDAAGPQDVVFIGGSTFTVAEVV